LRSRLTLTVRLLSSTTASGQSRAISSRLPSAWPAFSTSTSNSSKTLSVSAMGLPSRSSRRSPTSSTKSPNSYRGAGSVGIRARPAGSLCVDEVLLLPAEHLLRATIGDERGAPGQGCLQVLHAGQEAAHELVRRQVRRGVVGHDQQRLAAEAAAL